MRHNLGATVGHHPNKLGNGILVLGTCGDWTFHPFQGKDETAAAVRERIAKRFATLDNPTDCERCKAGRSNPFKLTMPDKTKREIPVGFHCPDAELRAPENFVPVTRPKTTKPKPATK